MSTGKSKDSLMQSLDGELICGVCLELFNMPIMLPCGHNFCRQCVNSIIDKGDHFSLFASIGPPSTFNCPVCQKNINMGKYYIENLPVNRALESIIAIYKANSPVDIFDSAWNADIEVIITPCDLHKKPLDRYCDSCNVSVCEQCEDEKHSGGQRVRHRVEALKQAATQYQTEIADILSEMKKKTIPLNDRIQLLEDMLAGMDSNEERVIRQLDHDITSVMTSIRQQQEKLKQCLHGEIQDIRLPVLEQLNKCKAIKTNIQELMKKLSTIKNNKNAFTRIKLMKDIRKQLNSVLYFDISWCLQDLMPEVTMPTWDLQKQPVIESVNNLHWKHNVPGKPDCRSISTQTSRPTEAAVEIKVPGYTQNGDTSHFDRSADLANLVAFGADQEEPKHEAKNKTVSTIRSESDEGSYDEHDGDCHFKKEQTSLSKDIVPVPVVNVGNETFTERQDCHSETSSRIGKSPIKILDKKSEDLNVSARISNTGNSDRLFEETFKEMAVSTNSMRVQGRSSFPMDSGFRLNESTRMESSIRGKVKQVSPTTTSEALASFVARRRTMSPSKFSPRRFPDSSGAVADVGDSEAATEEVNVTEMRSLSDTGNSTSPKSFSKQPIAVSLDFDSGSPTEEITATTVMK